MQEVFNWTFRTSIAMQDEIAKLIRNDYRIDCLSHCQRDVGCTVELSCFIIATKVEPVK